MKKIQMLRFSVQAVCLVLACMSLFINFEIGMFAIGAATVLAGAFFCGWICPYGFMQDIFGKLGDMAGIRKRKMPESVQKILVCGRYALLAIVILLASDIVFEIMALDPRANFGSVLSGRAVGLSAIAVIATFLLISIFFERPFCNYLCFEGARHGLVGSVRIFTVKRDKSLCVSCGKCDRECPMNITVSKATNVRSFQCINCLRCVSSCSVKGALEFGFMEVDKVEKKKYIAIVSAMSLLIASFSAYNFWIGKNNAMMDTGVGIEKSIGSDQDDESGMSDSSPHEGEEYANDEGESSTLAGDDAGTAEYNGENLPDMQAGKSASGTDDSETDSSVSSEQTGQAGNEGLSDANGIPDGIYTGEGEGFRGIVVVEVTVKDNEISDVEVVQSVDDKKWFDRANSAIPDRIVQAQSTDIDLVSGATYSSIGIRDAVKDALQNARQ